MTIEVVVYNIESAINAQAGGADRIELCTNPGEGGTTPSYGTIKTVLTNLSIDVFVMIRPRGGDFCYSAEEFESMKHDILQCKQLGAQGVVLGLLLADGSLDTERCKELIKLARPMQVTCHRAFDMSNDASQTLEDCIAAGFDRILTSGYHSKAIEGVDMLKTLVQKASGRISIMPGSGITVDNVATIVRNTKAGEIHFSAVTYQPSPMQYKNPNLQGMGSQQNQEYILRTVAIGTIKEMRRLAEQAEA